MEIKEGMAESISFRNQFGDCANSPMNIEFRNLEYSIYNPRSPTGRKEILKKINGTFLAGDLTAILGASGSGKSTLLNILAGFLSDGVSGIIKTNKKARQMSTFRKMSCYIMQDDYLQPYLSVEEVMTIAANLKLSSKLNIEDRKMIIQEILSTLGLEECYKTRTECLSGGQKKRCSLALELINNPPIIFLDEPTTGLDCVSANKCINVLKKISSEGRAVICSIHQPSKYIFDIFDQVYFLARGSCMYNGSPGRMESHLSSIGLICPLTWNLADYLIEIANDEDIEYKLKYACRNGKLYCKSSQQSSTVNEPSSSTALRKKTPTEPVLDFPTSFLSQLGILLGMTLLQTSRNRKGLCVQFINHFLLGLVTGSLFWNSGQNASKAVENFFFYLTVIMFFIYTHTMTSVLLFPAEVKTFKKEYSNRWYSLKAYYTTLIIRNIPVTVLYGLVFNCLVYILSGQRMDAYHFGFFWLTTIIVSIASEALGTLIGSIFNIMYGSVAAPVALAPLVMFSLYGIGSGATIHPIMEVLISFSYVRSGFVALCRLMLANQPPLECPDEVYCHYRNTNLLLRDMGMGSKCFYLEIMYICIFAGVCRVIGYVILRFRVRFDFEAKIKAIALVIFAKKL